MQIFYKELTLDEGYELALLEKHERLVGGREVSLASGIALFQSMRGQVIKCWRCNCIADRWIAGKNQADKIGRPVMNLFASKTVKTKSGFVYTKIVMMTRDHIIPKSLGGVDRLENLRPGCEECNSNRGSNMSRADQKFMAEHPELIDPVRAEKAARNRAKAEAQHREAVEKREAKKLGVLPATTPDPALETSMNPAFVSTPENITKWHAMIGENIVKNSGKPFKSGKKVGLALNVCIHEHTTNLAFVMDDGSVVECGRCALAPKS